MIKRLLVVMLTIIMLTSLAVAEEIGGVKLPDSLTVGEETLLLNGAGLRKRLFVKVYAGALYLMQKTTDPQTIIESDVPMAVRMHFIYDGVSAKKLVDAWNEGFGNATDGNLAPIQREINQFNACFTQEAKKDDIYDIIYVPGQGTRVVMKGNVVDTIEGLDFKKALFSIWFGKRPADTGLKEGMLGQ